jgi:hypothetical protein
MPPQFHRRAVARVLDGLADRLATRLDVRTSAAPTAAGDVPPTGGGVGAVLNGTRTITLDYPVVPRSRPQFAAVRERLATGHEAFAQSISTIESYIPDLLRIPLELHDADPGPRWLNVWVPGLDGAALYAFIASRRPAHFIEVGSGNSTKFVRRAIQDHGLETRIISIDPHPRAEVDGLCDVIVRSPLEDADLSVFDQIVAGDVVFVDNSHRCLQNSDATVVFCEVLPALPSGVLFGVHDIFLPDDYPPEWHDRLYSEQYPLATFVLGGANGGRVVLPSWYVVQHTTLAKPLDALWDQLPDVQRHGNGFWIET